MTHLGLICPAATGHVNPMTTLGYELQNRGHQLVRGYTNSQFAMTLDDSLTLR